MVAAADDERFMQQALFWAERGRGRTSPNPIVGAVVVSADGVVVGQGAHLVAGGPHAEVVALERAGERARGGTLYCTLEPCSHQGRTGPCCERVVAAGIRRAVVAVADANPLVSGRGLAYLREHGVEVATGVREAEAGRQLAPFFTWVRHRRPFVIAKTAVSADGFVGRLDRRVVLTGDEANRHFQRQRAEVDAIAVGAGTMLVDNPQLTARGPFRSRPLVRVIVDWRGRVPLGGRVFSTLEAGPVIMVVLESARRSQAAHFAALESQGVEVAAFESRSLQAVLAWLAGRDVVTLLVEGGPALQAALVADGLVDRVQWVTTPHTLGSGVPAADSLLALPSSHPQTSQFGADRLMEFDVHRID